MEYLDVVDENNKLTNEIKSRKIIHEKGLWHREVAVWIIKDKTKALIQKRSPQKKMAPNMWSITGGHINSGESIIKAAIRESSEELGLENLGPSHFKLIDVQKSKYNDPNGLMNNIYKYIYVLQTNLDEKAFHIQQEELSEVKYIDLEELKNLKKNKANMEKYTEGLFSPDTKKVIMKIEEFLKEENYYA